MIRIRTASRLHFGLFSLPGAGEAPWLNHEGLPALPRRHFGGVGLMIDQPGIDLTIEPASAWAAEGPLAQRALGFAQRYCVSAGIEMSFEVRIAASAPEHAGLGTGTQLGLAVARGIAGLTGRPCDAATLARHTGRGLRSALGIHGFERGGFLIEGGKTAGAPAGTVAPLLARFEFPREWAILLIRPAGLEGTHGQRERDAFAGLAQHGCDDSATEKLCRLVLLGMIPALLERDLNAFGESLYDFNRRVGAMFQGSQGGLYAHSRIEQIIGSLRELGIRAAGQSSWGPTVFAIMPADQAAEIRERGKQIAAREETAIVFGCNRGADFELA